MELPHLDKAKTATVKQGSSGLFSSNPLECEFAGYFYSKVKPIVFK